MMIVPPFKNLQKGRLYDGTDGVSETYILCLIGFVVALAISDSNYFNEITLLHS